MYVLFMQRTLGKFDKKNTKNVDKNKKRNNTFLHLSFFVNVGIDAWDVFIADW